MERVSIVCCYNSQEQFNQMTKSVKSQTELCRIIGVNNIKGEFCFYSKQLNHGLKQVETRFVIFLHQDIILNEPNKISNFLNYVEQIGEKDILGVVGAKRGVDSTITNVRLDVNGNFAGGRQIKGMIECDTVAECFFGGYTNGINKTPFDEILCNDWYMYVEERSLNALAKGRHVYVGDIPLIHSSHGKISYSYNVNFYNISKKYADKIDYIKTTCAYAKTSLISREWAFIKQEISIRLNRY